MKDGRIGMERGRASEGFFFGETRCFPWLTWRACKTLKREPFATISKVTLFFLETCGSCWGSTQYEEDL